MTERQKMTAGQLYFSQDPELIEVKANARRLTERLNALPMAAMAERDALFRELFGSAGANLYIENRFDCNYGFNVHIGDNFFANFGCVFLDDGPIRIGSGVMFAPGVHLYTATHQLVAEERNSGYEYTKPVTIEDNVWLGGRVVVNPGVTIGEGAVIGSGSVVTKDVPPRVFAAGNPCRVIREITEGDRMM